MSCRQKSPPGVSATTSAVPHQKELPACVNKLSESLPSILPAMRPDGSVREGKVAHTKTEVPRRGRRCTALSRGNYDNIMFPKKGGGIMFPIMFPSLSCFPMVQTQKSLAHRFCYTWVEVQIPDSYKTFSKNWNLTKRRVDNDSAAGMVLEKYGTLTQ